MRKLFMLALLAGLVVGCSSSQTQEQDGYSYRNGQTAASYDSYQIVDQEFENYVVENDNYDRVIPYEEQVNASSYIQSTNGRGNKKPHKTMVEKTVVDGNGNILSPNAKAPVTDQEALPDGPKAKEAQN